MLAQLRIISKDVFIDISRFQIIIIWKRLILMKIS